MLAIGILNSGIRHESDPAIALLSEYVNAEDDVVKTAAITGYALSRLYFKPAENLTSDAIRLGLAYAGTRRTEAVDLLLPLLADAELPVSVSSQAALSIGQIMVGSCDAELASQMLQIMMERDAQQLNDSLVKFMCLGLALLFLGRLTVLSNIARC